MTDIEIAYKIPKSNIGSVAKKISLSDDNIEMYGNYKAKIDYKSIDRVFEKKEGKLILVTAINPTPMGEGKTTVSIGLNDALNLIGKKSCVVLREPSMGPVFGKKGGATGGGYSQVVPMEDINLHFTGDIHAITTANNLLSALIDNHIYQGNNLHIKTVIWNRCLDLNDRSLRNIRIGYSNLNEEGTRDDHFDITVASEMMAILCLSNDMEDLKNRIDNIIIGYNESGKEVYAKDIDATGALAVVLKDALKPNLVQTLEHNPAIIHGGPFANIAHGCNSIIATNLSLKLAEYTIVEAGFGSDLGAEKFLDIKTRYIKKIPDVVVVVATIKALKYHGGMDLDNIQTEDLNYLKKGMKNLYKHINNIKNIYNLNVVVAINKFSTDTDKELNYLKDDLDSNGILNNYVTSYIDGGKGSIDLAKTIIKKSKDIKNIKYCYELEDTLEEKIEKVCKKIYGATDVIYSQLAKNKINNLNEKYASYPICIAKTPYSFSDDPKNLNCDKEFSIHVNDIIVKGGAKFIVIMAGNIFTMPGLPKIPAANKMNIQDENITGIF